MSSVSSHPSALDAPVARLRQAEADAQKVLDDARNYRDSKLKQVEKVAAVRVKVIEDKNKASLDILTKENEVAIAKLKETSSQNTAIKLAEISTMSKSEKGKEVVDTLVEDVLAGVV